MHELKIFQKEEFGEVRAIMKNGEPWFVAKDVCACLELDVTSGARGLDDDEKDLHTVQTPGGAQEMSIISEPGLYSLILRSRKPEAREFKRWVTHDILPSIRHHGLYAQEDVVDRILENPDFGIQLLQNYKFEREQRLLAEQQRDEAIRTKAQIGSRREATAMNTASRLSKENARLVEEYTERGTYMAVTAIPFLTEICVPCKALWQQAGKKLTALSERMKFPIHTIPDSRFGTVKKYHKEVIEAFRVQLINDPNMLGKYRRAA